MTINYDRLTKLGVSQELQDSLRQTEAERGKLLTALEEADMEVTDAWQRIGNLFTALTVWPDGSIVPSVVHASSMEDYITGHIDNTGELMPAGTPVQAVVNAEAQRRIALLEQRIVALRAVIKEQP